MKPRGGVITEYNNNAEAQIPIILIDITTLDVHVCMKEIVNVIRALFWQIK